MRTHPRPLLACLSLAVVMAGSGSLAGPVTANGREFDALPWLGLAAKIAGPIFPSSIDQGSDNRLTVLIVGSDWRPRLAKTGERTDSMIVMTINSGVISAVSLPRDVARVPIAPGVTFKSKINGLFKYFKRAYGTREAALEQMRQALEYTFQIQIDYVVYLRFTALERLVGEVGGVPVVVAKTIRDARITDERYPDNQRGATFLQSASTLELGSDAPPCYTVGSPINWALVPDCTRALEYVRSRHGRGNNDWVRATRQQGFIFAAIQRVLSRGSGDELESLRVAALSNPSDFYTTLPTDPGDVLAMYELLDGATLTNQAVLKPRQYAFNVPGTTKQVLRIDAVRALMQSWFGPLP